MALHQLFLLSFFEMLLTLYQEEVSNQNLPKLLKNLVVFQTIFSAFVLQLLEPTYNPWVEDKMGMFQLSFGEVDLSTEQNVLVIHQSPCP